MLGAMGLDAVRGPASHERKAERLAGRHSVEVVTGADAVVERLNRLRSDAAREVCTMLTGRAMLTAGSEGGPGGRSAVSHRTVVERPSGPRRRGGGHVRVVERIPAELVIADRAVALLPLASGTEESAALVVHAGALLDSLVDLFEDIWHEGRPLPAEPYSAEPDATDLEILSLLLAGLTDASVAKQLGLGLRTVQRRVRGMMELAGVTTRLQLGWHAAEHGWTAQG
ncbi:hypothetical protein GCM10020000_17310 [Streptomyces olivoverticillatus]